MASVYAANVVVCTINGVAYTSLLQRWSNQAGSRPATAEILLPSIYADSMGTGALQGKTCTITVDGTQIFTGHVWRVKKRLSDRSLHLVALDKRMFINADYVGRSYLETLDASGLPTTTNGIRVLGADIIFNKDGKPNKNALTGIYLGTPVAPDFIYNKGNVSDAADCATTESAYWTYGDILFWLWANCVTGVTNPIVIATPATIPTFGGLNRQAGEMNLFGLPVAEAFDEIFQRTTASWYLNGQGVAKIFAIGSQVASLQLQFANPDGSADCSAYSLDYPSELILEESIEEAITTVNVIGGRHVRQIKPTTDDFYAGIALSKIEPSLGFLEGTLANGGWLFPWSNCGGAGYDSTLFNPTSYINRWIFKHDRYEAHSCGRNIREKDLAKQILGEVLHKRDRTGAYVNAVSECGIYGVGVDETLHAQYPGGFTIDHERFEVLARQDPQLLTRVNDGFVATPIYSSQKPQWMAVPVVCEFRAYKTTAGSLAVMPVTVRRAIFRPDFSQKTTEAVSLPMPIVGEILSNDQWTLLEQIALPSGWSNAYSLTFASTTKLTPTDYVITTPSGVVFDALAALDEVVAIVEPETAKKQITVRGEFPSWRALEIGTQLSSSSPNYYDLSGSEIVVAVSWDGSTQVLEFQATNRLGAGIEALAQGFVDSRQFGRI